MLEEYRGSIVGVVDVVEDGSVGVVEVVEDGSVGVVEVIEDGSKVAVVGENEGGRVGGEDVVDGEGFSIEDEEVTEV